MSSLASFLYEKQWQQVQQVQQQNCLLQLLLLRLEVCRRLWGGDDDNHGDYSPCKHDGYGFDAPWPAAQ